MRRLSIALTATLAVAASPIAAINLSLTNQDVERALRLGRSSDRERTPFHTRYILPVPGATVRQIEVITEFRRYVLKSEERSQFGDWMFSQGTRAARDALLPWRGRVSIVAQLQFDPLNTYTQVPPFTLVLGGDPDVAPLEARVTPLSSLPFETKRGPTTYFVGATLESEFDAASVGQQERPVSVYLDGKELARARIDFGRLE